jgi:hypothetical protein
MGQVENPARRSGPRSPGPAPSLTKDETITQISDRRRRDHVRDCRGSGCPGGCRDAQHGRRDSIAASGIVLQREPGAPPGDSEPRAHGSAGSAGFLRAAGRQRQQSPLRPRGDQPRPVRPAGPRRRPWFTAARATARTAVSFKPELWAPGQRSRGHAGEAHRPRTDAEASARRPHANTSEAHSRSPQGSPSRPRVALRPGGAPGRRRPAATRTHWARRPRHTLAGAGRIPSDRRARRVSHGRGCEA